MVGKVTSAHLGNEMKSSSGTHSGWGVVVTGALSHAVSSGLGYFGLSTYFPSFEREFGWSRTAISGAFSLARIESGLLGPAEGYLTDRLGPAPVVWIGLSLMVLGFLGLSMVHSLTMLYLVMVLGIVLGSSLAFYVPMSVVVATLFRARRGLAFGIFRMGPGLAGALVPVVGWSIVQWGWRTTAVASAVIILAVGSNLARVVGRAFESYRNFSDGIAPDSKTTPQSGGRSLQGTLPTGIVETDYTLKEALRTMAFWMLAVATGLRHLVTEGVSVHFVVLLMDRGWSQELASGMLGLSAFIGAPARLGVGWLGDLVDRRRLMIALLIALSISVFIMGSVPEKEIFMPFVVVYSLVYGGLASLQEALRADYFGTRHFASIQGFSRMVITTGTFLGPLMAGFLYDLHRSYTLAFSLFAVISLVSVVCMLLGKPPGKQAAFKSG